MYDDILLPTDGSPGAEAAIGHAMHVANQNDAAIHAVHVLEITEQGDITDDVENNEDDSRTDAEELLKPILDTAERAGIETIEAVLKGKAHEKLVAYVEDHDIDLVVMATHGKSGLSRVLLGSTAEKVVRHSPAPVLTVREQRGNGEPNEGLSTDE